MRRLLVAVLAAAALPCPGQVLPGHRLPEGPERFVRERDFHVERYRAELAFDMEKEQIAGTATLDVVSLRAPLSELSLDAADLSVSGVERDGKPAKFTVDPKAWKLAVALDPPLPMGREAAVAIRYSCRPRVGMYFFPAAGNRAAQAWNYGEGGLHNGWLPLYNDTNDRFAVDLVITVPKGFSAVGNGRLEGPRENPDGTRTFHWIQDRPIPNYLVTVDVGDFVCVPLQPASVGGRSIPLSAWTPPGTEDAAKRSFGNTGKMIEFFSEKMGYPYPWDKYDSVALREFAVGAMETTSATGFGESHLHRDGDPPDSTPDYERPYPIWTYEDTIAHELAHHWFGDLVTCRSLSSIWLNESFASFWHTTWNGHAHGEDDLTYQRWRYLNDYLDYVHRTGEVRPMEYFRWKEPAQNYQQELTYIKGSLVLHMLRHFLGDEAFYGALSWYLKKHEFSNVDSNDLREAIERAAGRNVSWFFQDWIQKGGGHPRFEVSARWVPERKQVDLTVKQIQSDQPFENDFRLPVDVEIADEAGAATHRVEVSGWETRIALPSARRPLRVTFDKGGWLVGEVKYERPIGEVLEEFGKGDLAGRLRAARQLATDFPRDGRSLSALSGALGDAGAHWGLRQEAAMDLGAIGGEPAASHLEKALSDRDRRVRRAAALALGECGVASAAGALRRAAETDTAEDVAAAAEISLGRLRAAGTRDFLTRQLSRNSRYWDSIRLAALLGLGKLEDPSLAPLFESYADPKHLQDVRAAALEGWRRAAPDDPRLAERLRQFTSDRNRQIRENAIQRLAGLHHSDDRTLFEGLATDPDPTVAEHGREALEDLDAFTRGRKQ
ncbi:MAG: M1 family aminopeptidase [Acidobacteriota bacterium]